MFRGHIVYEHFVFGNFYDYYGVPDAWGFLMFCAGWTFLGVIFLLIAGISFADHALIGYIRVAVEAVALLSWLAGFIAVAVNIGSNVCPAEENHCGSLKAATVFGALEWLLFVITTTLTIKLVLNSIRRQDQAMDFYDQSRYTYLISGIGPPWTSEPSDVLRTIGSLAIVF